MREKAMSSDAGPPCWRALPDPTKRPVPVQPSVSELVQACSTECTDGATNGNHLEMATFQLPCERRFRRVLGGAFHIEDLSVGSNLPLLGDVEVGISPEAVPGSLRQGRLVSRFLFKNRSGVVGA